MSNTLIIADDHPIFRKGLLDILKSDKSFKILAEASDGNEALELILLHQPDVAILDVDMPNMSGIEVCRNALKLKSKTRFVILTMYKEEDLFNEAMNIGVSGYVLKDNTVDDIINCINSVAQNDVYISPNIKQFLISRKEKDIGNDSIKKKLLKITISEMRILKLISENKSSKEIAALLFISYKTVENHRYNICRKMELEGNYALIKFAVAYKPYF
jgi:DNA-binding NarL/FixJ family response regulator